MAFKPAMNTGWADGLRGIASIFVVSSHICLCFAIEIVAPAGGVSILTVLFQRPFFRLVGQGTAAVALYFVLLGFVNSLKPIQLSRAGSVPESILTLASSSSRRLGRLALPAAVCTVTSWLLCQLGFLSLARRSDAYWLQATTPEPSSSWGQAVVDVSRELISTWLHGENRYDQPQWTLPHLFKGSMYIFMFLLATVHMTPRVRLALEVLFYMWGWASNDSLILINVFSGMILAELSFMQQPTWNPTVTAVISYLAAFLGLYLCSFPNEYAEQARWSQQLQNLGIYIFPKGADLGRFWPALGVQILCLATLYSPRMRNALCAPWLIWMGRLSYPLYLLHGTFMRTVMTWLAFGPGAIRLMPKALEDGSPDSRSLVPQPNLITLVIALPVFCAIMLTCVNAWAKNVEPLFGLATERFEKFARSWGRGNTEDNLMRLNISLLPKFAVNV